jgi:response regulator RpfG family c-di-GMP phosphodiesterase
MIATLHNAVQRYRLIESNRVLEKARRRSSTSASLRRMLRLQTPAQGAGGWQKGDRSFAHEALKTNFSRSLALCQRILTTFNPLLGEQAKAATEICELMAQTHYFNDEQKHILDVSARLYDIGLTAVPAWLDVRKFQNDAEDMSPRG